MPDCQYCGRRIPEGVKFCTNCGQEAIQLSQAQPQSPLQLQHGQIPYQQQLPSRNERTEPSKKKEIKWKTKKSDIGAILIFIGFIILLSIAATIGGMSQNVMKAENMEEEYGSGSYDEGDSIIIRGTLEIEEESTLSNYKYRYYFYDSPYTIYSNQDLGDEGDTITIKCKVEKHETGAETLILLEYEYEINYAFLLLLLGGFALSWTLIGLGLHISCSKYRKISSQSQYPPSEYQQAPQIPSHYKIPGEKNTAGLILGTLSIVLFWFVGLGVVLGIEGLLISLPKSKVRAKFGNGGFILSIIGIIVGIIITILMFHGMFMRLMFGEYGKLLV